MARERPADPGERKKTRRETSIDMTETRFAELQAAIHEYGAAAFQNLMRCRALADDVIDGFPAFEGCPPESVSAVPSTGAFDPRKDYGDEAFSFAKRDVIVLEPVHFGIALVVGNSEDEGSLWLRTAVAMEIIGDAIEVFVAAQPKIRVPLDYKEHMEPIWMAIHREFLRTFTAEVLEFNDKRFETGIGFLPVGDK